MYGVYMYIYVCSCYCLVFRSWFFVCCCL